MSRLFVLIVAAIVIYAFLKRQRVEARRAREGSKPGHEALASRPVMACATCGVFIPEDEALASPDGQVFCSEAHRRQSHDQSR